MNPPYKAAWFTTLLITLSSFSSPLSPESPTTTSKSACACKPNVWPILTLDAYAYSLQHPTQPADALQVTRPAQTKPNTDEDYLEPLTGEIMELSGTWDEKLKRVLVHGYGKVFDFKDLDDVYVEERRNCNDYVSAFPHDYEPDSRMKVIVEICSTMWGWKERGQNFHADTNKLYFTEIQFNAMAFYKGTKVLAEKIYRELYRNDYLGSEEAKDYVISKIHSGEFKWTQDEDTKKKLEMLKDVMEWDKDYSGTIKVSEEELIAQAFLMSMKNHVTKIIMGKLFKHANQTLVDGDKVHSFMGYAEKKCYSARIYENNADWKYVEKYLTGGKTFNDSWGKKSRELTQKSHDSDPSISDLSSILLGSSRNFDENSLVAKIQKNRPDMLGQIKLIHDKQKIDYFMKNFSFEYSSPMWELFLWETGML